VNRTEKEIELFVQLTKKMGLNPRTSTDDYSDCVITVHETEFTVDVKGAKKYTDDQLFLVELRDVNGDPGWLFGKADLVAFQYKNAFIVVKRDELEELVKKVAHVEVGKNFENNKIIRVSTAHQSFERPAVAPSHYIRADRPNECITYVTGTKLLPIKWLVVNGIPLKQF